MIFFKKYRSVKRPRVPRKNPISCPTHQLPGYLSRKKCFWFLFRCLSPFEGFSDIYNIQPITQSSLGTRLDLTANIFAEMEAVKAST
jgi:hypothetical protein